VNEFDHLQHLPLLLVLLAAPLGALDVLYFHVWRFRLYEAPSARAETLVHVVRGLNFSAVAFVLANCRIGTDAFWFVGALLMLDVGVNVVDVLLESRSRAPFGGVPRFEYLLHIVGSTFAGGIATAYFAFGPTAGAAPPRWLMLQGNVVALGGVLLTLAEAVLFLRTQTSAHAPAS
jgi:hypothetical protein